MLGDWRDKSLVDQFGAVVRQENVAMARRADGGSPWKVCTQRLSACLHEFFIPFPSAKLPKKLFEALNGENQCSSTDRRLTAIVAVGPS